MEKKTLWMISGNKGGVGKSLFCLALASALELRGEQFAVLDGDGRTGDVHASFLRKCPARLADFRELRPLSNQCLQDEPYEKMVKQLLIANPNLIINTPDGADKILMHWFDKTLKHTEANNYQFKFIYLMSDRPDGLELLPELIQRFAFLYPIRNLHFGNEELFTTFNNSYAQMFHEVIGFPALRRQELRMLFDCNTYPAEALRLKASGLYTLPALSRARLHDWQMLVLEALGGIIDNKEVSNITAA